MNFPNNEIPIGFCLVICSTSIAMLPLTNELIVETTYPAGEATSTAITVWLAGPLSGVYIALSSLVQYGDQDEYPDSTCREGELQDLSWFLSIMNGIFLVYYLFFDYFYRKDHQFLFCFKKFSHHFNLKTQPNGLNQSCPYLRQEALRQKTVTQIDVTNERIATISSLTR